MERNRGGGVVNMNGTRLVSVLALLAACQLVTSSRITMDQDGGYKRIVVKISKDVPEAHCPTLLKNIKVGLNILCTFCTSEIFLSNWVPPSRY